MSVRQTAESLGGSTFCPSCLTTKEKRLAHRIVKIYHLAMPPVGQGVKSVYFALQNMQVTGHFTKQASHKRRVRPILWAACNLGLLEANRRFNYMVDE